MGGNTEQDSPGLSALPPAEAQGGVRLRGRSIDPARGITHHCGRMSARAPLPNPPTPAPRRYEVRRDVMVVEGHALNGVELAGYLVGQPLGTAPVMVVVGGITASPFPFGEPASGAEAWWPSLLTPDLIDPSRVTVLCPCWPGNGSTWRGFDEGAIPALSALGLADLIAAWLDGLGCTVPVTYVGASLGGLVGIAFAVRHAERCARLITISAGLRPDGWGTASWYATGCAPATWRPGWSARASSAC
jgi:homoserine acetyltransferase